VDQTPDNEKRKKRKKKEHREVSGVRGAGQCDRQE